jgi:hypothetical protein
VSRACRLNACDIQRIDQIRILIAFIRRVQFFEKQMSGPVFTCSGVLAFVARGAGRDARATFSLRTRPIFVTAEWRQSVCVGCQLLLIFFKTATAVFSWHEGAE